MPSMCGGKADGLFQLSELENINVPKFTAIPADADDYLTRDRINDYLKQRDNVHGLVAVRSSALNEDTETSSMAGVFDTHLNISPDIDSILKAVENIKLLGQNKNDQGQGASLGIVIQDMVENPEISGVILSTSPADLNKNYALVNYAKGYGTEIVSGKQTGHVLSVARDIQFQPKTLEEHPFLPSLMAALQTIEQANDQKAMDIEFCYKNGEVFILQARPMVLRDRNLPQNTQLKTTINQLSNELLDLTTQDDFYGDMIDINPRELLGNNVKELDLSLFEKMFAGFIVEETRKEMGYSPLERGLLKRIGNKPYISLKHSAFSMRPAGLDDKDFEVLYHIYKERLTHDSSLQDSVEFSVFAMTPETLERALQQTSAISTTHSDKLKKAFTSLEIRMHEQISNFPQEYKAFGLEYNRLLENKKTRNLDECLDVLQTGTRFFVKTARLAFFQKHFFSTQYNADITERALTGIKSSHTMMAADLIKFAENKMDETALAKKYGHLRMGQMNIASPCYASDIKKYLNLQAIDLNALYQGQEERRLKLKDDHSFLISCDQKLAKDIHNIRTLLSAREGVKFSFMRAYQMLADTIEKIGQHHDLSLEQLSHLKFDSIRQIESGKLSASDARELIDVSADMYHAHAHIKFPETLSKATDLACISHTTKDGYYFTNALVEAPYLIIDENNIRFITKSSIEGKIVILDRADPGFDCVLMCNPAGIVTKVGGPASHIAIRVNELGIPACIGAGINIDEFRHNKMLVLDCRNKKISEGSEIAHIVAPTPRASATTKGHYHVLG